LPEMADIFRQYGPEYLARFPPALTRLPSHIRAMEDIVKCRTPQMGGHLYQCENPSCQQFLYSYHSCCNRSCPKCGQDRTEQWLLKQQKLLLHSHYFLVTFTLPFELRAAARSNQRLIYDLLFKTSAAALQKLAKDPRFIGGKIGMMGGLHTWRRDMGYHPHLHYIIPGGALSPDKTQWLPSREDFLLPVEALSVIFRAKFRDGLKNLAPQKAGDPSLFHHMPEHVWQKDWVVHIKPLPNGTTALKYLAPYVYRIAITNNRILNIEQHQVTFRYKNPDTETWETTALPAMEFIRRFLQHVLPKRFIKIRYYGFLSPTNRHLLNMIHYLLGKVTLNNTHPNLLQNPCCLICGANLRLITKILPLKRGPPHL
jgi:hypothetical protein